MLHSSLGKGLSGASMAKRRTLLLPRKLETAGGKPSRSERCPESCVTVTMVLLGWKNSDMDLTFLMFFAMAADDFLLFYVSQGSILPSPFTFLVSDGLCGAFVVRALVSLALAANGRPRRWRRRDRQLILSQTLDVKRHLTTQITPGMMLKRDFNGLTELGLIGLGQILDAVSG